MKRFVPVLCLFLACTTVFAQARPVPAPPVIGATSYLMIDSKSGHELASLKPDTPVPPASLTKLMTTYVVFHAIAEGQITLEEEVTISEKAWRMQGSRMFIEVGNRVRVKDLLLGVIVQSGNDASVALAEYVAGSEEVFAQMMNQYAQALGMTSTHFVNATGWPDDDHYSTARDLAILARALIEEFRNRLLWRDDSVDGLKTGHTEAAGYCLVASAERDGMRIISVVLGTASEKARIDGSQAMLNYGFRFFETRLLYKAGEEIARTRVWKSANEYSPVGVMEDLYITVPRGSYDSLESVHNMPAIIEAPVASGQPLGEIKVSLNDEVLMQEQLRALDDNPAGSLWQRTVDTVMLWME
jgi:D-alanyl-D-alanine carboxypeptidase (penicillin-binding protein 5/6)